MARRTVNRWYTSAWFIAWIAIAVMVGLMTVAWGLNELPDPANIAPGGDSSDVERRYATFWVLVAVTVAFVITAVAGARFRDPSVTPPN